MAEEDDRIMRYPGAVFVSGRTSEGLKGIEVALQRLLPEANESAGVGLTRARHAHLLQSACVKLRSAVAGLELRHNDECVALELRGALTDLGLLLGENVDEDVLDSIFSEFCIGK
jgi:tRNA modification GTPase